MHMMAGIGARLKIPPGDHVVIEKNGRTGTLIIKRP
jgi:hypothetical protein